jgi:hypothetical protein
MGLRSGIARGGGTLKPKPDATGLEASDQVALGNQSPHGSRTIAFGGGKWGTDESSATSSSAASLNAAIHSTANPSG